MRYPTIWPLLGSTRRGPWDRSGSNFRAALLLALTLAIAGPTAANASVEGLYGGQIAFDRTGPDSSDLFVVSPDGSGERRLPISAGRTHDSRPAWAPAGPYEGDPAAVDLGSVTPGATVQFQLSPGGVHPVVGVSINGVPADSFSVDSNALVTATVPAVSGTKLPVCVVRSEGFPAAPDLLQSRLAGTVTVSGSAASGPGCSTWQPIAFQSDRTGDYDIWAANPDDPGSLTDLVPWRGSNETQPAWSNSADQDVVSVPGRIQPLLAFTSDRAGSRDIYIFDMSQPYRDGVNPSRVTTSPADDANPDFSTGTGYLTFQSDRDGQSDIWTLRIEPADGGGFLPESGLVKVTPDAPPSYDPAWFGSTSGEGGPAAGAIAFSGPEEDGTCAINYLTWPLGDTNEGPAPDVPPPDPGALDVWTVDPPPTGADSPSWSAYGDALTFQAGGPQSTGVYSLATDDRGTQRPADSFLLAGGAGQARHPSWQPLPYSANPDFIRPIGRRHKRRHKPPPARAAQSAAQCIAPPSARVDAKPASAKPDETVTLTASRSESPGGHIQGYQWDVDGNGTWDRETAAPTTSMAWHGRGDHVVAVRVTDDDGATDVGRLIVPVSLRPSNQNQPVCTKVGTRGADRLQGTSGRDVLCGLGGNDLLIGLGGNDVLLGGRGRDRLSGGAGADQLKGGTGNDVLLGGTGADRLYGDAGRDTLKGQAGGDRLYAKDRRRDLVDGGSGSDRARVDRRLDHVHSVEHVTR